MIGNVTAYYLTLLIFVSLAACASMPAREAAQEIMISGSVEGAEIQLNPPLLRIDPGQKVIWTNRTDYEIQINLESDSSSGDRLSLIRPFSAVRGTFDREGTYSYTLVYTSSKTFGKVTGTIIVGNPPHRERPLPRKPKEALPEETPGMLPEII
jgi:plastocyanin